MSDRRAVALVTGACSGIGLALARRLASQGHDLVLVSNRAEALGEVATELARATGARALPITLDLARREAARELHERVRAEGLTIDVLINNAGMFFFGEVVDADPERAASLLELHVVTPSLLATLFGREMRERRSGRILFVSSLSAFRDMPGIGYYGASKKYLMGFARSLRSELAVYGVRVTCLAPGPVDTALYSADQEVVRLAKRLNVFMSPERVAEEALAALERDDELFVPGAAWRAAALASRAMPQLFIDLIRARAPWLPPRT